MKTTLLAGLAASLMASAATAAPLAPAIAGSSEAVTGIEQVRLVCDQFGRCFRTRGPRYVQRYYGDDDAYVVRRSYNYYDGPRYYDHGYSYYGGGPSIGFSFGTRGW